MNLKNEITGQTKDHLIWSEEDKTYIHKEVFPKLPDVKPAVLDERVWRWSPLRRQVGDGCGDLPGAERAPEGAEWALLRLLLLPILIRRHNLPVSGQLHVADTARALVPDELQWQACPCSWCVWGDF